MFILDTDHLSVLQEPLRDGYHRLRQRMKSFELGDFYLTIVTFHEQVLGGHSWIQRAKGNEELIEGYRYLERALGDATRFMTLPFDEPAARLVDELRPQVRRIGTMDLRIAAIALSHDMTVLTRNARDFEQVPELKIEDWTR